MYQAISIAATGLINQQRRIDVIADNMANINTIGFKASRLDFKDALHVAGGLGPVATPAPTGNVQKGLGVMMAAVTHNFENSSLISTEEPLDFAIIGEGFVEVQTPAGELRYNTGGTFYLSNNDDGTMHIVTAQGYSVLDSDGQPIFIPEGMNGISIAADGAVVFHGVPEEDEPVRLGLYTFANPQGLSAAGVALFETTVASGEKIDIREEERTITVKQGYVERSNVDLAQEVTRLIRAQRVFQLASRALTTADDMEGIANNMKRS